MRDEQARKMLSRYLDADLTENEKTEIEQVLASSGEARHYLESLQLLRKSIRYETAESPDVTHRVMAAVAREQAPKATRNVRWAAAFAAGLVAGIVFIGITLNQPAPVAAANIPERVLAAQSHVSSLSGQIQITERGFHPEILERSFSGQIMYRAPESLWLQFNDDTTYPSADWIPNHSTFVVDQGVAWSKATAACPIEAMPSCTPSEPRIMITTDREPFPEESPAPLDLVVPVASFSRAAEPDLVGLREVDGRDAVGVVVSAAQAAPLIEGLTVAGNWREVHPTDRVELWLDQDSLVPLALSVLPADTSDRRLWAIRNGYLDQPDVPILEVNWTQVSINALSDIRFPAPPIDVPAVSEGFRDVDPEVPGPPFMGPMPDGMNPHRVGDTATEFGPEVSVASWSDGRAWLKVRWTSDWTGSRLFGELGDLVTSEKINNGIAYLNEHGDRVALHADGVDVLVQGSLPTATLLEIAAGLELTGIAAPDTWAEAATASLQEAAMALEGLLVPSDLEGFAAPAIRVEPDVVTLSYAGPGNRRFLLTQAVDQVLSPPFEADVRGVTVRGLEGRYSPGRGLLEWVEGNLVIAMASTTLTVDELVDIAETMGPG